MSDDKVTLPPRTQKPEPVKLEPGEKVVQEAERQTRRQLRALARHEKRLYLKETK